LRKSRGREAIDHDRGTESLDACVLGILFSDGVAPSDGVGQSNAHEQAEQGGGGDGESPACEVANELAAEKIMPAIPRPCDADRQEQRHHQVRGMIILPTKHSRTSTTIAPAGPRKNS
jgi:hypothetical protein